MQYSMEATASPFNGFSQSSGFSHISKYISKTIAKVTVFEDGYSAMIWLGQISRGNGIINNILANKVLICKLVHYP